MSDFDKVMSIMSEADYPATCNQCGMEGTNATFELGLHTCLSPTTEFLIVDHNKRVESLQNDIELAKGITELTRVTDLAISLLAKAILELDANGDLDLRTVNALTTLAKESTNE